MWPIDGRRYEAGEVLQLEGGIQSYLAHKAATATATQSGAAGAESGLADAESGSSWRGHCFVFDERIAVGHGLTVINHQICPSCQYPIGAGSKSECAHCR